MALPFGISNAVQAVKNNVQSGVASAGATALKNKASLDQAQHEAVYGTNPANSAESIGAQTGAARALGSGIQGQGQSIFAGQNATAGGYDATGQGFNASAQSVTAPGAAQNNGLGRSAGTALAANAQPFTGPMVGNSGFAAAGALGGAQRAGIQGQAPAPAAPAPGFQVGQRATAGNMGSVSNVAPGALGAYGSAAQGLGAAPGAVSTAGMAAPGAVAGKLGGAPGAISTGQLGGYSTVGGQLGGAPQVGGVGNVAGGFGGGYQVGGVGGIAGSLGGAPQVGTVGNIQTGGAPGSVQGTFGNQGVQSADQQSMMGRLNGFLDSPEGPSVAEAQLREAQATNMGQMIGLARSGRGGAGAQAQALEGAMSEGGAIASQTAGQLATLRAQEADMQKNRALSAIGLGGDMATSARGQDIGIRAQNLAAAQGDQSTQLGSRGQDITAAMANQSTQSQLEQLRAQTALGARGQDLSALQGDQSTALGLEGLRANTAVANRGQDLSAAQGDQSTQLGLRGLEANTALGARGQDLSALQGDQSASIAARGQNLGALQSNQATSLGARGQNLSALQGDQATSLGTRAQDIGVLQGNQSTALGARGQNLDALSTDVQAQIAARGQNLSALQGNQASQLGARGQNITQEGNLLNANTTMRQQDVGALTADADRNLAAQQLSLQGQLGYGALANDARGQGLAALGQANQQALMGEGMAQDATNGIRNNATSINNAQIMADAGLHQQIMQNNAQPTFAEKMGLTLAGAGVSGLGVAIGGLSDERAKTDIAPLDSLGEHLRGAPGYRYRYKEGFGEDSTIEHAGPMAQDLERGPFGRELVKKGPDGLRRVDTVRLSLVNHAALSAMRSELDRLKEELSL